RRNRAQWRRRGLCRDEAPQLAGPIQPNENLAEQPLVAGGLAARLEQLDGGLGDRRCGLAGRERAGLDALRRCEQAWPRHELRIAAVAGPSLDLDVAPGSGTGREDAARRDQLDDAA